MGKPTFLFNCVDNMMGQYKNKKGLDSHPFLFNKTDYHPLYV
jgi:hypothetical protein